MLRVGPNIPEPSDTQWRLCVYICTAGVGFSVCAAHIRLSMKTLPQLLIVAVAVFVRLAVNYVLAGAAPSSFSTEAPELQQHSPP